MQDTPSFGIWGQRHLRWLKKNRRVTYTNLLTTGELYNYLQEIDTQANEQLELLIRQLAKAEGITEQLKADDQMEWVRRSSFIADGGVEMLILEDLYLGDVRPSERSFKRNSQYAKALDEVVQAGDALIDTLTEKQKELFEDYMTAQREVNVLTDCETFIYAFRLAAKTMIDVLTEGTMRVI